MIHPVLRKLIRSFHCFQGKDIDAGDADIGRFRLEFLKQLRIFNNHAGNFQAGQIERLGAGNTGNRILTSVFIDIDDRHKLTVKHKIGMNFIGNDFQLMLFTEGSNLLQFRLCIHPAGWILRIAQDKDFRLLIDAFFHILKIQGIISSFFVHRTQNGNPPVGQRLIDKRLISRGWNQDLIALLTEQPDRRGYGIHDTGRHHHHCRICSVLIAAVKPVRHDLRIDRTAFRISIGRTFHPFFQSLLNRIGNRKIHIRNPQRRDIRYIQRFLNDIPFRCIGMAAVGHLIKIIFHFLHLYFISLA